MKISKVSLRKKIKKILSTGVLLSFGIGAGFFISNSFKKEYSQKNVVKNIQSYEKNQMSLSQNRKQPSFNSGSFPKVGNNSPSKKSQAPQVAAAVSEQTFQDWVDSFPDIKNLGGPYVKSPIKIDDIKNTQEYKNWWNNFQYNRYVDSSSIALSSKIPGYWKRKKIVFGPEDGSLSKDLWFGKIKVQWNSRNFYVEGSVNHPFKLTWDHSIEEQNAIAMRDTFSSWDKIIATKHNQTISISGTTKEEFDLEQAKDLLRQVDSNAKSVPPHYDKSVRLFVNGKLITQKRSAGDPYWTVPDTSRVFNFHFEYPKSGIEGRSWGPMYRFPKNGEATFEFTANRINYPSVKWFTSKGNNLSLKISGTAPYSLKSKDVLDKFLNQMGGSKPSNTNLKIQDLTFGNASRSKTATITYVPSDGSSYNRKTKSFTITYDKTKNEGDAYDWFSKIPTTAIVQPYMIADANNHLTSNYDNNQPLNVKDALKWLIGNEWNSNKPKNIGDLPSFVGTIPHISVNSKRLNFKLNYPIDGQKGTSSKLSTKSFKIIFKKTIRETETSWWWSDGDSNIGKQKRNSISKSGTTPKTVKRSDVLSWLGVKDPDKGDTKQSKFNPLYVEFSGKKLSNSNQNSTWNLPTNKKSIKFTFSITTDAVKPENNFLKKDFTINWDKTIEEDRVEKWVNSLNSNKKLSGYPKGTRVHPLNLQWFKNAIGWTNNPSVTGTFEEPKVTTNGILLDEDSFDESPGPNDKSWNFTLTYRSNGISSGKNKTKNFHIEYEKSRQEHFDSYDLENPTSANASGGLLGHYTALNQDYGFFKSKIDTTQTPNLDLVETLNNKSSRFFDPAKNISVKVKSAHLREQPNGKYKGAEIIQDIVLEIKYLTATRTETITVTYAKAKIEPFYAELKWGNDDLISNISVGPPTQKGGRTSTKDPTIKIPSNLFEHFDKQHFIPFIVFGNVSYDPNNNSNNHVEIKRGKFLYKVPVGLLKNNDSNSSLDIKIHLELKSKFLEWNTNDPNQKHDFPKTEALKWPVWINTDNINMFDSNIGIIKASGQSTADWKFSTTNNRSNSRFKVMVRWEKDKNNTRPNPFVDIKKFALSSQVPINKWKEYNIWDQTIPKKDSFFSTNGDFSGKIEAMLAPVSKSYVVSNTHQSYAPRSLFDNIPRLIHMIWVPRQFPDLKKPIDKNDNLGNFFLIINKVLGNLPHSGNKDHHIDWGNTAKEIKQYADDNNFYVEFSFDENHSNWRSTKKGISSLLPEFIPAYLKDHSGNKNLRYWFFSFSGKKNFIVKDKINPLIDGRWGFLLPELINLKGLLDPSNSVVFNNNKRVGKGQPSNINMKITGATNNPRFSEPNLIEGIMYKYSVDGGSNWTDKNTFIKNMKSIHNYKSKFMWKLFPSPASKYALSSTLQGHFDVSGLKTYIDISKEIGVLNSGLNYKGEFGKGHKVYVENLGSMLSKLYLKKKRVKLQYKITSVKSVSPSSLSNWTDLPSLFYQGGPSITGSKKGGKYIKIASDIIPSDDSPKIIFRFVPSLKDDRSDVSINQTSTMQSFENASTAVLSNTSTPHYSQIIILPTIVSVGQIDEFDFTFTTNKGPYVHSRNFQIDISKTEEQKLKNANPSIQSNYPAYWKYLHFVFAISDGSGVKKYWFKKDDFEKWMHGDFGDRSLPLPSVWEVPSNNNNIAQIEMNRITLPSQFRVPKWNSLDTTTLKVRWSTDTTKNTMSSGGRPLYYATSDSKEWDISNFTSQVLKWYDPTDILDAVESVYIEGNTNFYNIKTTNVIHNSKTKNLNKIEDKFLSSNNLKREFSNNGSDWSEQFPSYNSWKEKNDRILYMRVVPRYGYKKGKPFASSLINRDSVYLAYYNNRTYASFNTSYKNSKTNERYFKAYVDASSYDFAKIKIKGTQYLLGPGQVNNESQGVDESVDSNNDDYSVIEFQYLYNNNWLTKNGLIQAIARNRIPKSGSDLSSITFPKDFANNNVKVRWNLTGDSKNYVLSSSSEPGSKYSNPGKADASNLKNFVNIWNFQSEVTKSLVNKNVNGYSLKYNEPKNNLLKDDELITGDYDLKGSLNSATLKLKGNIFNPSIIDKNHLIVQYTTAQFPTAKINGNGWIKATKAQKGYEIFKNVPIDNQHKSLWIRVIVDPSYSNSLAVSSYQGGGNSNIVQPIKIDATRMKFLITTSANSLAKLNMSGTTQLLNVSNFSDFFSGSDAAYISGAPGKWGIWYQKQVPGKNSLLTINDVSQAKKWVRENGLTIRWKVKQTRVPSQTNIPNVKGKVNFNDFVEFDTLFQLAIAIKTSKLNFDSSTLRVQWGILPGQRKNNEVSDTTWVAPTNAAAITNVIFSRDFVILDSKSVETKNNTIATTITPLSRLTTKIPRGLQLEYSFDGKSKWTTTAPVGIGGKKKLFIRLNNIPKPSNTGGYILKDPKADAQVTSVDNSNVYTAIPLAQDNQGTKATSKAKWEAYRDTTKVSGVNSFSDQGYTILNGFAIWVGKTPVKQLPTILPAEDGQRKGHWEYSIDNFQTVYLSLEKAMKYYYGSEIRSFDKDREKYFSMRYVLKSNEKKLANNKAGYVFTDASGIVINSGSMSFNIDITHLTQYLYIDNSNPNLPSDQFNTVTNMSWRQLANEPKFRPGFKVAASGIMREVDYTQMEYRGQYIDAQGHSLFKFDVNPFTNKLDSVVRKKDNMLAPRHAHFEYSTKQSFSSNWTPWTRKTPINRPLESNNKYFRIRISPDHGYEIPKSIFNIGDQNWSREFTVVILKNTEQITFDSIQYTGFNYSQNSSGRIKTNNSIGDFTKGDPLINLKKSGLLWNDYKDTSSSSAFVMEYNVYNNNVPISWTDTSGKTQIGWHASRLAPPQSKIWYGDMPVSLKNGDVIHIRFRAKNGFVIDDNNSLGRKADGTAPYSSEIILPPIKELINELTIPQGFRIYDTKNKSDFVGNQIQYVNGMPTVTFEGFESVGTINFTNGNINNLSNHIKFMVQVLRPTSRGGKYFDLNMRPASGYQILDTKGNIIASEGKVWELNKKVWKKDIDYIPNTWVDPLKVNWLQVGDAIRIRVMAKKGFGFKWEDPKNSFKDIVTTPKTYDQFSHNKNGVLSNTQNGPQGTSTPIPVTGLLVKPPKLPSQINVVYSSNPADNIQGNVKNIKTSIESDPLKDKWFISFKVYSLKDYAWSSPNKSITPNIFNGDKVEISIKLKVGYDFDPSYKKQNKPHTIIIKGLKDKIDMTGTSKPIISFQGYQGKGYISEINPSVPKKPFDITKDGNGFPKPKIYSSKKLGGVKWQYQVYESDPSSAAESAISLHPWLDTPPKNLKSGWYIRMRVAPKNPADVVLAQFTDSNSNIVWSELFSQSSYNDQGKSNHQKGWVEVKNLKLNPNNIGLKLRVSGFIERTTTSAEFTISLGQGSNKKNTADEDAVMIEFQNDAHPGTWYNTSDFNDKYSEFKNGDSISMRVTPRNNKILYFDPKDPAIGHNGYSIEVYNNINYLRNNNWDNIKVSGLKKYIDVTRVALVKPNSSLGLGNFKPMSIGQKEKISGEVELIKAELKGLELVSDVHGNKNDPSGKPYKDYLVVNYTTTRVNLDTGEFYPPTTTQTPPTKLKNGDRVVVELGVTNDEYKLSQNISTVIEVDNLQEIIDQVEWPKFTFTGNSGEGAVKVDNSAPTGFRWEFTVQNKGKNVPDGQEMWSGHNYLVHADNTVDELEEFTNKGVQTWRNRNTGKIIDISKLPKGDIFEEIKGGSPIDLSNGDEIKARLVSIRTKQIARLKDPNDPSKSSKIITPDWTTVSGLVFVVDLSSLRIKVWNDHNPYKPNSDNASHQWTYPFRLKGKQDESTSIVIDALINPIDGTRQLLDTSGNPIPFADKLEWEFAVDDYKEVSETTAWSKTIPRGLKSNQFIHARLSVRRGVEYTVVKNSHPQTFQIPKLEHSEKISSNIMLFVGLGILGSVLVGGLGGLMFAVRTRRKLNYRIRPKM